MPELTVIVPTFNEEENLDKCLTSVQGLADELIVVDAFSTDKTLEIARKYGAKVIQQEYRYSASQKNRTIPQAKNEWILLLDADEWATDKLQQEVKQIMKAGPDKTAYWIYRENYLLGKRIRYSGWQNDKVIRLFHRDKCRYEDKHVHAEVVVDGTIGTLKEKLGHNTFKNLNHYLSKLNQYSTWSAKDYEPRTGMLTPWHFVIKPLFRFVKHYFIDLGILDGVRGFFISVLMAGTVLLRYIKIWVMRREKP